MSTSPTKIVGADEDANGADVQVDEEKHLGGISVDEIEAAASVMQSNNAVADGKIADDVSGLSGPLVAKIKSDLARRFPEADLAGLATQLQRSLDGCPSSVYEYNQPVGVHAGEVTPQTIAALGVVVESLLAGPAA